MLFSYIRFEGRNLNNEIFDWNHYQTMNPMQVWFQSIDSNQQNSVHSKLWGLKIYLQKKLDMQYLISLKNWSIILINLHTNFQLIDCANYFNWKNGSVKIIFCFPFQEENQKITNELFLIIIEESHGFL